MSYFKQTRIIDTQGDVASVTHQGYLRTRASEDSMFNDVVTVERTNLIELKSNVNVISVLRDITVETNGSVTATDGEYVLATTATTSAQVVLDSAEIGRYQPGFAAECGIGVRSPSTITGDEVQRWGYFDDNNGFFFGKDASGVFVVYRRDGDDDVKVYQENWNIDNMLGTNGPSNPSGTTLDPTTGNIFQIRFAWYGYGVIEWRVVTEDINTMEQEVVTVHRYRPSGQNSTTNPNLPIRAEILNNTTATAQTLYVGGRQFSILGRYDPRRRVTSQYRIEQGSVGTTFLPTVSTRRKNTAGAKSTSVKIEGIDVDTDASVLVQIRIGATLTGASYATPSDHSANETATESDNSATAVTGGDVIYQVIASASGVGSNAQGSANSPLLPFDLSSTTPVTVCVRRLSGTNATVTTVLRVTEEW